MSLFNGLASGIQTGMGIQAQRQQMDMQRQQMAMQQRSHETQQRLAEFRYDQLRDQKDLVDRRNSLQQLRYRMGSMRKRADAGETITQPELEEFKKYQIETLNRAFPEALSVGGNKTISDLVPVDNERFAIELDTPTGKQPMTVNRSSDPNDEVATFSRDDLYSFLSDAEEAVNQALVGTGDYSPIQRREVTAERQRLADVEQKKFDREQQAALHLERVKQSGRMDLEGVRHDNNMGIQRERQAGALELQKAKSGPGGGKQAWNEKDVEKHIPTTLAKLMGLEGSIQDWDVNQRNLYAQVLQKSTEDALQVLRSGQPVNVNAVIAQAYDQVTKGSVSQDEQAGVVDDNGLLDRVGSSISRGMASLQGRDQPQGFTEPAQPGTDEYKARVRSTPSAAMTALFKNPDKLPEFIEKYGFIPESFRVEEE